MLQDSNDLCARDFRDLDVHNNEIWWGVTYTLEGFRSACGLSGTVPIALKKIFKKFHVEFIVLNNQNCFHHKSSTARLIESWILSSLKSLKKSLTEGACHHLWVRARYVQIHGKISSRLA